MRAALSAGLVVLVVLLWPLGSHRRAGGSTARPLLAAAARLPAEGPGEDRTGRSGAGPGEWSGDGLGEWSGEGPARWARLGGRVLRRWRTARRARARELVTVLDLLDALAPALRSGLSPAAALRCLEPPADESGRPSLVAELCEAADAGAPLAPAWSARAHRLAASELHLVAAAWSLSESLGAPLADSVALGADLVRQRLARERRLAVALAGPRATIAILTLLPAGGPALALLLGVSPAELYLNLPAAVSLGLGLMLLGLGRWWCTRMVRGLTVPRPAPETS